MSERFTADLPFVFVIALGQSVDLTGAELLLDRGAIEPDVLSAYELVAEFEHVQDAEGDRASVARKPQHLAGDNPGHHLLEHECVLGGEGPDDGVLGSPEVRREIVIEAARLVLAVQHPARPAHHVVFNIVGVHRYRTLHVARPLGLDMALDLFPHCSFVHVEHSPHVLTRPHPLYRYETVSYTHLR